MGRTTNEMSIRWWDIDFFVRIWAIDKKNKLSKREQKKGKSEVLCCKG